MSDEDRAAKAARAKAMLKKRQQKKTGTSVNVASREAVPGSLLFRTKSPAPSEYAEEEKVDLGDIFSKTDGSSERLWLESLPQINSSSQPLQVTSPSSQTSSAPPRVSSTAPLYASSDSSGHSRSSDEAKELRSLIQNQQQTISLLVSEKASLLGSLDYFRDMELKIQETDSQLQEERKKATSLCERVQELEMDARASSGQIVELTAKGKDSAEKLRDQERDLQLTKSELNGLRPQIDQRDRRIRDLQEQIQNDDRVERLEQSLKNTQDRADELEFQLSKLKQASSKHKIERDALDAELRLRIDGELEWKEKHAELESHHASAQSQLQSLMAERDGLQDSRSGLETRLLASQEFVRELQQKLAQATIDIGADTLQLQIVQAELKVSSRRAEEAEKTQQDLQSEGTTLMKSLDEMRSKVVELTGTKVDLMDRVDSLEKALRNRDSVIGSLESSAQEIRLQLEEAERLLREAHNIREEDRRSAEKGTAEMQQANVELQDELQAAFATVRELETERAHQREAITQKEEDLVRLTAVNQGQTEEMKALQADLQEHRRAGEEHFRVFPQVQMELETARVELASKDQEIACLRECSGSLASAHSQPQSLDGEITSALRQQHALEFSAAQSQIRNLETSLFEAEAMSHMLQKQLGELEDQLALLRSASREGQRAFSPSIRSRPSSRGLNPFSDQRTLPVVSRKSSGLALSSVLDQSLSAETRHKRRVSLGMLKARIDSELSAAASANNSSSFSRPISPISKRDFSSLPSVLELSDERIYSGHSHSRPQFLDESHIFWCHCCFGDLVVL